MIRSFFASWRAAHQNQALVSCILAIAQTFTAADAAPSEPAFKGKISVNAKDSVPDWQQPIKPPANAPNILIVLLDDIGFADASTFGGLAETPAMDKLAARGLRYNDFHTTAMCSPTRAALLTGRNHHRVGFGVAELSGPYPGYDFIWRKDTVSIAEVLRRAGYSTSAFGKWHNTPYYEVTPAGPFDRWPTGLGFDYFYGFIGGVDHQWEPSALFRNTTPVEPGASSKQGYHLTTDITDDAIRWLRTHQALAAGKPYFLYFAPGAVHEPHHVPQEWIDRYRGRFDRGWDVLRAEIFARQKRLGVIPGDAQLTPRPKEIPSWSSLSADRKKLYARQMEVYAAFVAHTDHEVGRLLSAAQEGPGGENTLILYIVGDNGATAEAGIDGYTVGLDGVQEQLKHLDRLGGPRAWNQYSAGWAWMGNTPHQGWKMSAAHFGGTRTPLVLSWPARIRDQGGIRSQFSHVNGVAATIYEASGVRFPAQVDGIEQQPLDGASFASSFSNAGAASAHRTQYFEMLGNRAIYQDGWVAAARHNVPGFTEPGRVNDPAFANDRWELYQVSEDFSQARDLAARYPQKLEELQQLFDREARSNDVYPLGGVFAANSAKRAENKREFVYHAGTPRLQTFAAPPFSKHSYRITAATVIPTTGAQGVLVSYGKRGSGFTWYVQNDRLIFESNRNGVSEVITSDRSLPAGKAELAFEFAQESTGKGPEGPISSGTGRLYIDGQLVGERKLTCSLEARYGGSFGVGKAFGSPVSDAFELPFEFNGTLENVTVQLK